MKLKNPTRLSNPCLQLIAEAIAEVPQESPGRRIKLMVRGSLSASRECAFKSYINDRMNRFCEFMAKPLCFSPEVKAAAITTAKFCRTLAHDLIKQKNATRPFDPKIALVDKPVHEL